MSDRIVGLNGGRIVQFGSPVEIYDTPQNIFVAQFIGSPKMHMFDGIASPEGILLGDTVLPLKPPVASGTPVVLGIRPENLDLATEGDGLLPMMLQARELTGAETYLIGDIAGTVGIATYSGRLSAKPGERLWLEEPVRRISPVRPKKRPTHRLIT